MKCVDKSLMRNSPNFINILLSFANLFTYFSYIRHFQECCWIKRSLSYLYPAFSVIIKLNYKIE